MTGQPLTTSTTAPKRRVGKALIAIIAGYALAFLLRSDGVFLLGLLGIFVMIGGYIALALATYPKASGRGASDLNQPDPAAAIKAHFGAVMGWFAVQAAVVVVGLVAQATLGATYLFPLLPLSMVVALMALGCTGMGLYWTWKCARAVRTFKLAVRPFHPLNLSGNGKRSLYLGDIGSGESPIMVGMDPLLHDRWPARREDWVWFAGDDTFGGTVMLPHSGMLIFAQPKDWDEAEPARKAAGPERTQLASRAGLLKRTKM
ncbi:hypothetical protein ACFYWS_36085 [Streptomyces sp. NPDC002795]|uniref:hypothetical protein n=1 Tax=Streptomyces sp. NPDC002795 TaxID=3364665 RepID=UPI003698CBC2